MIAGYSRRPGRLRDLRPSLSPQDEIASPFRPFLDAGNDSLGMLGRRGSGFLNPLADDSSNDRRLPEGVSESETRYSGLLSAASSGP